MDSLKEVLKESFLLENGSLPTEEQVDALYEEHMDALKDICNEEKNN